MSIRFGLYPGGAAGDDTGRLVIGPPDNPDGIRKALEALERGAAPLIVRAYAVFTDEGVPASAAVIRSPRDADQLAHGGRSLDLVVQYQSRAGDVDGYAQFVRNAVRRYGAFTATLQIAEEPNVAGNAALDGDYPDVLQAIASGVAAANDGHAPAVSNICGLASTARRCSGPPAASTPLSFRQAAERSSTGWPTSVSTCFLTCSGRSHVATFAPRRETC